ncbi:MAG: sulfite exporter TauE/SafE family protein, partial [Roseovarius indicus]
MPEALTQGLATPGLIWLLFTIGLAGIVRGFSGFGTALIFVPVANIFLEPKTVVTVIALTGVASNAVVLPRAWGQASRGEVG